jgi:hypothetical protein
MINVTPVKLFDEVQYLDETTPGSRAEIMSTAVTRSRYNAEFSSEICEIEPEHIFFSELKFHGHAQEFNLSS